MTKTEKIRKHPKYNALVEYFSMRDAQLLKPHAERKAWIAELGAMVTAIAKATRTQPVDVRNAMRASSSQRGRPKHPECPACKTLRDVQEKYEELLVAVRWMLSMPPSRFPAAMNKVRELVELSEEIPKKVG